MEEWKNGMVEHEKIQIKTTDCRLLTANNCSLATAHQLPIPDRQLPTVDLRLTPYPLCLTTANWRLATSPCALLKIK
jgi:hypothetical protein